MTLITKNNVANVTNLLYSYRDLLSESTIKHITYYIKSDLVKGKIDSIPDFLEDNIKLFSNNHRYKKMSLISCVIVTWALMTALIMGNFNLYLYTTGLILVVIMGLGAYYFSNMMDEKISLLSLSKPISAESNEEVNQLINQNVPYVESWKNEAIATKGFISVGDELVIGVLSINKGLEVDWRSKQMRLKKRMKLI